MFGEVARSAAPGPGQGDNVSGYRDVPNPLLLYHGWAVGQSRH
jgi:hypothetical protein